VRRQHHVDPAFGDYSLDGLQVAGRIRTRARAAMDPVHPAAEPRDTKRVGIERLQEPPKIIEEVARLGARGHVVFGGRMPLNPRGPMEHAMVKNTPPEYRDRRDWDEIRAWAAGIASELGAAVPSA